MPTFFPGLAEGTRNLSAENTSRTSANRRNRKNKYSGGLESPARERREKRGNKERPLCNRYR